MKLVARFYREYVTRYWRTLLVALVLTVTVNQAGFTFSMLGKWLVDDVLQVGQSRVVAPPSPEPSTTEPGESADSEPLPDDQFEEEIALHLDESAESIAEQEPDPAAEANRARMTRGLIFFLSISIGLHFLVALMGGLAGYLIESTGQRVLFRLRVALKRRLTSLSVAYYSRNQTGQLMVRVLDDANAVQANTVNLPVNFVTYLFTLGIGLFLLWRLNPGMTLVAMAILPFYAAGSMLFMRALRRNTENIRTANAELQSLIEEDLSLISTIKSYSRESAEERRFFRQLRHNLALAWRQNKLNTGLSVTLMIISGLGATGVLLYGFLQIRAGEMQIGAVLAFYHMTGLLFGPVTSLTNMSVVLQTTRVLLQRVYDVLDTRSDVTEDANPVNLASMRGEIDFENVSLRYGEGPVAVQNMTFHIDPGERVALLGTSGSGRTTVAYLLMRFYDPVDGAVKIDGVDVRRLSISALRSSIGLASQEQRLFTGTIRENIAFGARGSNEDEKIEEVARLVGVHEMILALPDGYDTRVGKGGMQLDTVVVQRIAVARVLIGDPAVLVFDDSASTLSDEEELSIYQSVAQTFSGRTQMIITNRVLTALSADRIFVLRSGSLIEQGKPEELLESRGVFWRMYLHQTQRPEAFPLEKVRPDPAEFVIADQPPEQAL